VILEVVGEAEHGRELAAVLLVEVRIAAARVQCPMVDADVGKAGRVIGADRHVCGGVHHEAVHAPVPLERSRGIQVTEAGARVALATREHGAARPGERGLDARLHPAESTRHAHGSLAARDRRREDVRRRNEKEVCPRVQACREPAAA